MLDFTGIQNSCHTLSYANMNYRATDCMLSVMAMKTSSLGVPSYQPGIGR